jgi:hypothetical protein
MSRSEVLGATFANVTLANQGRRRTRGQALGKQFKDYSTTEAAWEAHL